jgi:hypothetical protein
MSSFNVTKVSLLVLMSTMLLVGSAPADKAGPFAEACFEERYGRKRQSWQKQNPRKFAQSAIKNQSNLFTP